MIDNIIPMTIGLVLAFILGALWGLSRHEWLYCRVGAHLLLRMREAMKSLGIEEWKIDKTQEYIGSVVIPPYIPMPTPPTVKDDLMEPVKWSEEDEKMLDTVIEDIVKLVGPYVCYHKDVDWLKSLKDRVQPQKECYNPYKIVVESIAEMCKHYDKTSHSDLRDFYDNVKVKCNDAKEYDSLYPQSQWKPSNEQMKALNEAIYHVDDSIATQIAMLIGDLKKL